MLGHPLPPPPSPGRVRLDPAARTAVLQDGSGRLRLRLNAAKGCVLDRIEVGGRSVLGARSPLWTGVETTGGWATSGDAGGAPRIVRTAVGVEVRGIEYGGGAVREDWTFATGADSIRWTIARTYVREQRLEDTAMPRLAFPSMDTWTGALLGTGGVAWGKLLDRPNATYGVHTDAATFWKSGLDPCLSLRIQGGPSARALAFTRGPEGDFSVRAAITRAARVPRVGKARFLREAQNVWAGFSVAAGERVEATLELKAASYRKAYGRGDFKGLDTAAITELLNTIGRIGVIDQGLVGTNGWYSGYICQHEPWHALVGTAIDDPAYTRSEARMLDFVRDRGLRPDGMVMSRWYVDAGDAQPGTYDPATGFYEAQWGRLMDSQSSFVMNVADEFDATGDRAWVRRQKAACESALGYLLRRDRDGDHLVEMENDRTAQKRSSDWIDIVWASHENALVNVQLYGALRKWADVERVLGDGAKAAAYRSFAARLKASFDKPLAQGGFWDPAKGWYAYWRDADGTVHGDNLVVPVQLTALGEGLCDDPARRRRLLDTMAARMRRESLLTWPLCFDGYAPGEGRDDRFPTYENGDLFLSWAEYGVRAYAPTRPDLALGYVRRIVDQYKKDGLAFQRYLRASGEGAGDDILGGNCSVVSGLYRDVYGIQPKYDRLLLAPHLTPALNGTRVDYALRGRALRIDLSVGRYRVESGGVWVRSAQAFGVDFGKGGTTFFPGEGDEAAFRAEGASGVDVREWGARKRWSLSGATSLTLFGLRPGRAYRLLRDGRPFATLVGGRLSTVRVPAGRGGATAFELR